LLKSTLQVAAAKPLVISPTRSFANSPDAIFANKCHFLLGAKPQV